MQFKWLGPSIQVIQLRKKDKDISARTQISKKLMFIERRAAHTSGPRPNDKKKKKKKVDIRQAETSPRIQALDDEE